MISSLVNYLWPERNPDPEDAEDEDDDDQDLLVFEQDETDRKRLTGARVTRVQDDYFILDDQHFWPRSIHPRIWRNQGQRQVQIGDQVIANLERRSSKDPFQVVSVEEVLDPEEDGEQDEDSSGWAAGDGAGDSSARTWSWLEGRGLDADDEDVVNQVAIIANVQGQTVIMDMQDGSKAQCDWAKMGPTYKPEKGFQN